MNDPRHIQLLKQQFANNPARLTEVLNRERSQSGAGETSGSVKQKQGTSRFHIVATILTAGLILKLIIDLFRS